MKVTITEEGMIRTGEYVNKLRKAQQDGEPNANVGNKIDSNHSQSFP